VMLMGLVTAVVAMVALQAVRHRFRGQEGTARTAARSTFGLVLLNPVVIAFLVVASLLWAGPVTHTGGHASAVVKQTVAAITGNGQDGPGSSDTSYRLFAKDSTTASLIGVSLMNEVCFNAVSAPSAICCDRSRSAPRRK